jgi:hypothetical protein
MMTTVLTTPLDLSPIVNGVIVPLLTPVLLGFAMWALNKVAAFAHFQVQDGQRQMVSAAIDNAIAYAAKTLGPKEVVGVDAHVAAAAAYLMPKIPGALKSLNVTPEHLRQIIAAKLD